MILVVDAPIGSNTSASVQMLSLAKRLAPPVLLVAPQPYDWELPDAAEDPDGLSYCLVKMPDSRAGGYWHRAASEILMPVRMFLAARRVISKKEHIRLVCYSPSIFLVFFGLLFKLRQPVTTFLILRDIFPDWALQLRLISKGPAYYFFKLISNLQLYLSDIIAVQAHGDLELLPSWVLRSKRKTTLLLRNWLPDRELQRPVPQLATILGADIGEKLEGKRVCLYAGTLGVAQDVTKVARILEVCREEQSLIFLFVGSGSAAKEVLSQETSPGRENFVFADAIPSSLVRTVCEASTVGLVSLDGRHKSHHVPGKFLSYIQAGLPVAASINSGNELEKVIENAQLGIVDVHGDADRFARKLMTMISDRSMLQTCSVRCRKYFEQNFSVSLAASTIEAEICKQEFVK